MSPNKFSWRNKVSYTSILEQIKDRPYSSCSLHIHPVHCIFIPFIPSSSRSSHLHPVRSVSAVTLETAKEKATVLKATSAKDQPLPFYMQFIAGGTAGVTEICFMYPLDVIKTRFQLQVGTGSGPDNYTSIYDCFKKIIKNEG